jgi:hypothetical protein
MISWFCLRNSGKIDMMSFGGESAGSRSIMRRIIRPIMVPPGWRS